ncbi:MAG TPA: L-seryl-tRNA(Sec) selenium transferase, partial [Rhodospirillaceae bacterium]|nr:L-seryl-tRNA(Sec) selenium transferase [Rhodospirillaceae bacterium]
MGDGASSSGFRPPSADALLQSASLSAVLDRFGRQLVTDTLREVLAELRTSIAAGTASEAQMQETQIAEAVGVRLSAWEQPSLRPVFNLSGTVLHTNLGRAPMPTEAIDAVAMVAKGASNLEYDLAKGRRGDRDSHIEPLICKLTGAEAATVVNNNAAAVLLVLNALALRKEVPVSRGELVEIGGSFRIPDIMARAGCKLREIGTTNRTHKKDFAEAIGSKTALLMSVHTSNYEVTGFTASVPQQELAALAHENGLPYVVDLGSGMLVDMSRFGLPHEPTPQEAIADGADLVTFSGDKLLGGPQAGLIVGRADLIAKIKKNPLKRALRLDKMTIAALDAVLRLYLDPDRLLDRLPSLKALSRSRSEIMEQAIGLTAPLEKTLGDRAMVKVVELESQIGSGAQPTEVLPSAGLSIEPAGGKRGRGARLKTLAKAFRELPVPVIGRIGDDAFLLD